MLPEALIDRQVAGHPAVLSLGVPEWHHVDPFPAKGLDKALDPAVGSGRVGTGSGVAQFQGAAGLGGRLGDVDGSVVAHHRAALNDLAVEPDDRTAEQADYRWFLLVRKDLDIGQPHGVNRFAAAVGNDRDMDLV